MNERLFMSSPDDCRGTDFWMLNDRLEDEELVRQLRDMRAQGVTSVIVRTYIGLKSDYPGPDFKAKMHVVVNEAEKLGMALFMQAGYMPEAVLGLPQEFILGNVQPFPAGQGQGTLLSSHGGTDYCLTPSLNILDMLSQDAMAYYIKQSYADMWDEFRDQFGKTIVSMWVDEPSYAHVSLPWTKGLPAAYEKLWSCAFPMEKIYLLFEDGDGDALMRYRFWRTVLYLLTNSYFKGVSDWGRAHKIRFSGHLMAEDTMEGQIRATCFTMPCYKYFDIPGLDYLETAMNWRIGEIKPKEPSDFYWRKFGEYNTPLQCTSAAHQAGKKQILCEMYGVSTENLNLRDQKSLFDHFAALGVNHRSVHGLFYSLRGRGKRAYPPHVNSYQPYWPRYHKLTDTIARESWFVRQGNPVRDIALLHPMDTAFCLYHGGKNENAALKRYDAQFNETLRMLLSRQDNFELGDEDSIAEMGAVKDDTLVIGQMNYKTVVLPFCRNIRFTTLARLTELIQKGGRVIVLDALPTMVDGEEKPRTVYEALEGAAFATDHTELGRLLDAVPHAYHYEPGDDGTRVEIYYAEDGEEKHFFMTCVDRSEAHAGRLTIDGCWQAARLNPEDGTIEPYPFRCAEGRTTIPVELTEGGSLLLTLKKAEASSFAPVKKRLFEEALPSGWTIERHDKNALLIEMFRFARSGQALSEKTYPILAIQEILSAEDYHGDILLSAAFENEIPLKDARLVLEEPDQQVVAIDGVPVDAMTDGFYWAKAFETVKLPDIEPGKHTLSVKRFFQPIRKAKMAVTSLFENLPGVELEPMFIIGDFAVKAQVEPSIPHVVRMAPHFVLTRETFESGDEIVRTGYPFYCGSMSMSKTFMLDSADAGRAIYLSLDGVMAGCAEVYLNGKKQGDLLWTPYRVRLADVKPGENTLTIKLYGTIRNMIGPWHRPVGEIGAAWGGYSFPNLPWLGAEIGGGKIEAQWYEDRTPDRYGWTESYLLLPFGVKNAKLMMEE